MTHPAADMLETEPSARHEALAQFIEDQTGYEPDITTVQLTALLTPEFRGSDADKAWREQAKADKKAASIAKRQEAAKAAFERRRAAASAKLEELAAEEQAKLEAIASGEPLRRKKPAEATTKAAPAKKAPAKKAAPKKAADEVGERRAAKAAPRKTAAKKRGASPVVPSDDDF